MRSAALSAYAILIQSFTLVRRGRCAVGLHNAFWQQLRFAAGETSSHQFRSSRAISYVMAGGVAGALFGPELAKVGFDLFEPVLFAQALSRSSPSCAWSAMLLAVRRHSAHSMPTARAKVGRPLGEIAATAGRRRRDAGRHAGLCGHVAGHDGDAAGDGGCGFVIGDAARVIQWHAVGHVRAGFFTGHLIRRFGVLRASSSASF